jgi:uncharacterized membrane protein YfcA
VDAVFFGIVVASFFAGVLDATVGGGGFILIPALVFAGNPIAAAIGTSRVVFLLDSFSAFVGHARKRNVDYKIGAMYCVLSVVGAQLGAAVTSKAPADFMGEAFGFFMLAMLFAFMLKPKMGLSDLWKKRGVWVNLPAGFFVGFMIGLFGGGVGVLLMLSLILVSGTTVLLASGTQQLVVWVTNISAVYAYHRYGLVDYNVGLILGFVALVGAQAGVYIAHKVGDRNLRLMLYAVTLASAAKLLIL